MSNNDIGFGVSTEKKLLIGGGIICLLILIIGYWMVSRNEAKSNKPLVGTEVPIKEKDHVPVGTKITYSTNPPTTGKHYEETAHAGFYEKPVADGHIVHSLEHGAVVLWYKADLPKNDLTALKNIFDQTRGKTIMMPRKDMDVPLALTSWGRILKLKSIDEVKIIEFFETNIDRGPEQAPI